jgi:putative oxidoreductase
MATAGRTVHAGKGPWATNGGWEFPLTLAAIGATLAFTGPGKYSLDGLLRLNLAGPRWGLGALALGLGSAATALAIRRSSTPQPAATDPTAAPTGA